MKVTVECCLPLHCISCRKIDLMQRKPASPARFSSRAIQTTRLLKRWGMTGYLYSIHIHDKPLLPSLPAHMKPSNLSLECPREVANVSSYHEDLLSILLSPTVSTVWSHKANLRWHVRRHLTFKKNSVWGQKRKAAPVCFVFEVWAAGPKKNQGD